MGDPFPSMNTQKKPVVLLLLSCQELEVLAADNEAERSNNMPPAEAINVRETIVNGHGQLCTHL